MQLKHIELLSSFAFNFNLRRYSKFLLMQFPVFGLALLPLKPVIDVWYSLGFLQIIVFFALYLGVTQNQSMTRFVRFNAQQAGAATRGLHSSNFSARREHILWEERCVHDFPPVY